jgi:hypothetical protein
MTVQELIDAVRLRINERPAFIAGEYLEHWIFRDAHTQKIYTDIGRFLPAGRMNDTRPLGEVGISPGNILEVIFADSRHVSPQS